MYHYSYHTLFAFPILHAVTTYKCSTPKFSSYHTKYIVVKNVIQSEIFYCPSHPTSLPEKERPRLVSAMFFLTLLSLI